MTEFKKGIHEGSGDDDESAKKIDKPSLNDIYELDFGVYIDIRPEKK